ncbi:MAG: type II secretion system protein GspD [Gammaproteobacteria bacterium]|nr:MAG: type II secretion system protein GspD [Gammaproteobacteria bacterium]
MKIITRKLVVFLFVGITLSMAGMVCAQEQTWKINIKNADIREFVAQVAEITGKTFVIDPRLKGDITVISSTSMDTDAIYALFLSVLRVHNFTASPSGNVIRIQQTATGKQTPGPGGSLANVAPEELVTRVIAAQNVESSELVKILRPLMPQYGGLAAVAKPNVVIVSDHADNIIRLMRIIEQIDIADEEDIVVVPLKEAWVGTMVALLEKVAPDQLGRNSTGPQRIQIIANERNNSLVIRGKPKPIAEILKLIDKLDQPATTIGATQVIYLKHADAIKVTEILNGLISDRPATDESGASSTSIQADESLNAIIVRSDPGTMNEILGILDYLDVRRTQVVIEAAIVEVTLSDTSAIGVEMAAVDESGNSVPLVTTTLDGVINALLGSIIGDDGELDVLTGLASLSSPAFAVAKINPGGISFAAIVRALATSSEANLLSSPYILTLDNQEAKIVVGNEVPFRTGSFATTGDGSSNPFTTIQREDVGLQLTVTPHVHEGSSVRLEILLEITSVVDTPIGDDGFSDVVTSKRTIETTILAEDRQTIVLGGLIQDDITDTDKRVPLLGDIPLLGRLFRSTTKSHTKRNLLIFLRPTVIRTKEDADAITDQKYRGIWEVEITSTDANPDQLFQGDRP